MRDFLFSGDSYNARLLFNCAYVWYVYEIGEYNRSIAARVDLNWDLDWREEAWQDKGNIDSG